ESAFQDARLPSRVRRRIGRLGSELAPRPAKRLRDTVRVADRDIEQVDIAPGRIRLEGRVALEHWSRGHPAAPSLRGGRGADRDALAVAAVFDACRLP